MNFKKLIPKIEDEINGLSYSMSGRRIRNLEKKVADIKSGQYLPTKTDLKELRKEYKSKRYLGEIDNYINSFDSDNKSFFLFNTASPYKEFSGYDLVVKVRMKGRGKEEHYIMLGLTSDRLDGKVSDAQAHWELNKLITSYDGGQFILESGSGGVYGFTSFEIVDSYKYSN